jgi:hypothetical protein
MNEIRLENIDEEYLQGKWQFYVPIIDGYPKFEPIKLEIYFVGNKYKVKGKFRGEIVSPGTFTINYNENKNVKFVNFDNWIEFRLSLADTTTIEQDKIGLFLNNSGENYFLINVINNFNLNDTL